MISPRHEEVHEHLLAADFGLMIRQPSATNMVASPIKFAEYLAAGVGVIASRGIGDLDGTLSRSRVGQLVDRPEEAAMAARQLVFSYQDALELLATQYDWDWNVRRLLALYEAI